MVGAGHARDSSKNHTLGHTHRSEISDASILSVYNLQCLALLNCYAKLRLGRVIIGNPAEGRIRLIGKAYRSISDKV